MQNDPLWTVKVRYMPDETVQISVDNGYWLTPENAKRLATQCVIVIDAIATLYYDGGK